MTSTGKGLSQTQMLTRKFVSSIMFSMLSNLIPHKTILCDDKDPSWFNSQIKSLLQAKNIVFKTFRKKKTNTQLLNKLNFLQERLNSLITKLECNYYERMANKLNNLKRNCKPHWPLFKCF